MYTYMYIHMYQNLKPGAASTLKANSLRNLCGRVQVFGTGI